jgi:hypothetical protein
VWFMRCWKLACRSPEAPPVVLPADRTCAAGPAVCAALQVIHPNGFTQMTGLANLHPEDWFKPFQPHLTSNHV